MSTYRLLFLLHPCKQIQTLDPAMDFKITKSTEKIAIIHSDQNMLSLNR